MIKLRGTSKTPHLVLDSNFSAVTVLSKCSRSPATLRFCRLVSTKNFFVNFLKLFFRGTLRQFLWFGLPFLGLLASPLGARQLNLGNLLSNIPAETVEKLKSEGTVLRYDRKHIGMALAPNHSSLESIKRQYQRLEPNVLSEGLYLIPYPKGVHDIDLNLYNITRRVSKITEVTYQSDKKKAVVPLFDKVYRIQDVQNRRRLEDEIVDSIPMHDRIFMYMKEVVLGSGFYETQYVYDGESLGFFVNNVSVLRPLIKVADKNNLAMNILIFAVEEGYLVYGFCAVNMANMDFISRMMDVYSAFYKRMYAMVVWVENSLHGTDKQPVYGKELDY
ncbi:MAG: hypothetical protein B0D92_01320 [Spirochaeta sp. LUC14_002_19_P3]|nr:MAG: hypothetical protein B0D92_01320 [Spirochaeta sp. LUC14_002_19_P3]